MVGHWWNLKGVEWDGYQKEYCEFLTSNPYVRCQVWRGSLVSSFVSS
jgi:hypothetical protein